MKTKYAKPIAVLAVIFFPVTLLIVIIGLMWGAVYAVYKDICNILEEGL